MPAQTIKEKAAAKKSPVAEKTPAGKKTALGLARPPTEPASVVEAPRARSDGEGPKVANAEREGDAD